MKLEKKSTLIDKIANLFGRKPQSMTLYNCNNLRDFLDFADSKQFENEEDTVLTMRLESQVKIKFLDNTNRAYWYNELTQNENQANQICENYLKSGFQQVETIDISINKPVYLYFHKSLMSHNDDFDSPEIIIQNPVIGFHILDNHAYGTIYEAKIR